MLIFLNDCDVVCTPSLTILNIDLAVPRKACIDTVSSNILNMLIFLDVEATMFTDSLSLFTIPIAPLAASLAVPLMPRPIAPKLLLQAFLIVLLKDLQDKHQLNDRA